MANRTSNRLSAQFIKTTKELGLHSDGNGLYLQVTQGAKGAINKSWLFKYQLNQRKREMGLGSLLDVSLQDARKKVIELRQLLIDGKDPLHERNLVKALIVPTFGKCCEDYVDTHKINWKNSKSELQWRNTLSKDAKKLTNIPVNQITMPLILQVLEPIWESKHDTAVKLRGRIEKVLDYAKSKGYRSGENPALMKGNIEYALPKITRKPENRPSLHWRELPTFIQELRLTDNLSRRALEFTILTATRTAETKNAQWSEFDLEKELWVIGAERMKAKKDHIVPLSSSAMKILTAQQGIHKDWVFYNPASEKPLSDMAMLEVIRGMTPYYDQDTNKPIVVHGFRATFKTWALDATNFPDKISEDALAHQTSDKAAAAYIRTPEYEHRKRLLEHYAQLVEGKLDMDEIIHF